MTPIAHIAVTDAGRARAAVLARALGGDVVGGTAAQAVRAAWATHDALLCHLAVGATTRLLAPLLTGKHDDPAVVCVDEAGRFVVPLVGGHARGGNDLARAVSEVLGATPVVTTASDAADLPPLDELGLPYAGDVAGVTRAMLDGDIVHLRVETPWPLPPLPLAEQPPEAAEAAWTVVVTDRSPDALENTVVLHPPSLVVGVGASRGAPAEEVEALVSRALSGAGLAAASVAALATVDLKADEEAVVGAAARRGVPLRTFTAAELRRQRPPNPSDVVAAEVGTPSVAEAAVLASGASLLVHKTKSPHATVAAGRLPTRGTLTLVGLGPGARDLLTPRARAVLRAAAVVVGLDQYVDQVRDLLRPGTRVLESGLGSEEARARTALEEARGGRSVALVCSGDAGVYAMASPTLEMGTAGVDVEVVPGVTAALAAAALSGAPLGHDHAVLSLSDLHTAWPAIERRLRAVAESDLAVALYNPRSRRRTWQLSRALDLLRPYRSATTPVVVVRDAGREGEEVVVTSLGAVDPGTVTMRSVVLVGASTTRLVDGRVVTPRGYRWLT